MSKKAVIILVAILTTLIIGLAGAAGYYATRPDKQQESTKTDVEVKQDKPKLTSSTEERAFKSGFMIGCEEEMSTATCECMYNKLVEKYGYEKLYSMSGDFMAGDVPNEAIEAVLECL